MKIVHWNVCNFLPRQVHRVEYALTLEADIICLLEVTRKTLEVLKSRREYQIAYVKESKGQPAKESFLVILSKYPILSTGRVNYYDKALSNPFTTLMAHLTKTQELHRALYVDIKHPKVTRVYGLHLSWPVSPSVRMEQFQNFIQALEGDPSHRIVVDQKRFVLCADLNVFGGLATYARFTGWLFGRDRSTDDHNERAWFDSKFEELGMQNPFAGTISWPLIPIRAQLDHLLVPATIPILEATQGGRHGSDHTLHRLEI